MLSPGGDPLLLWKLSVSTSLTFISKDVLLRRLTYQCSYEKRMTYWCSLYALGTLLFEFLQLFTNGAIQYHLYNDMSEKEILINNLAGKFNKERVKQMTNRNPTNAKISIATKCIIRSEKQIYSTSKHSKWSVR